MSLDAQSVTGPNGQIASELLLRTRKKIEPQARNVRDDLYCLMGLNICNTHLVLTPGGFVVVDTGRSSADGEAIIEMAATISEAPIIAVIYTHSHYTLGTGPILEKYPDIPIIAHHRVHENTTRAIAGERRFMARRARMESARRLPESGPDADSTGSRIYSPGAMSYVRPTVEIHEEVRTIELGGVPFTIHTTYPFDTDDTIFIWLPDRGAILHNHFSDNFPNVYPIQGGRYRDPLPWLAGLDRMRRYRPEHLLSTNGAPSSGRETCMERLTVIQDALQFVHDQTIRGMNRHLEPEAIVESTVLPPGLRESHHLYQTYGIVENHVRGIYSGLAGWFDGAAASIYPPTPDEEAAWVIRDMGGPEAAITRLQAAVDRGEYRWATRLGRWLYRLLPDDETVRTLYAGALRHFGQHTTGWTIRSYYLTEARLVEGSLIEDEPDRTVDTAMALLTAPGTFIRALGYRIDPSRFPAQTSVLEIRFSDSGFSGRLILRNGVAEYVGPEAAEMVATSASSAATFGISCPRAVFIEAVDSRLPFASLVRHPEVTCSPSAAAVEALLAVFD
jgi:alkyl sulfatase BDS1-like metallo-beta-lactamase superfamily hydrolase